MKLVNVDILTLYHISGKQHSACLPTITIVPLHFITKENYAFTSHIKFIPASFEFTLAVKL